MPFSDYTPRLNFLKESAGALSACSPSTAAYLMTVHNHIFLAECRPLNQRQQEASCGACGSMRNDEFTKTIRINKKKAKRVSAAKGFTLDGATVYKCLRCHRRTIMPARQKSCRPQAPRSPSTVTENTSTGVISPQQAPESVETEKSNKAAENASSKKRAKARKQGGLQALLASKQKSQASSSSLDLFDFLQQ
ncbi:ribonuclease P Rpr2/Rpp21/SNM1 subunit [Aspergillus tanneri]|uniref:Cullin-associated NEDD8-dissociated protein 1 n=1 Tax=Aspergillus tanneri TaxID=1220188 RepID=A0A5M9MUY4_9EURO|nr:uncharacterized protein ATNIH1004_003611 [Aspergillus tanneri]KAA8650921.1 hypothetical protein ATNIH1004_003611 [Aspergillus tanneri]